MMKYNIKTDITMKHWFNLLTMSSLMLVLGSCIKNNEDIEHIDPKPEEQKEVDLVKAIDLGLSVKWANFNVGAGTPEKAGNYYSWGETEVKKDYSWNTYKFGVDWDHLTKYYEKDGLRQLELIDDAANVQWGGSWRMPTYEEMQELIQKCTWKTVTQKGVVGQLVTAPNGNSIFLPANGKISSSSVINSGKAGYYWTSSLEPDNINIACYLTFSDKEIVISIDRNDGMAIRPVCPN